MSAEAENEKRRSTSIKKIVLWSVAALVVVVLGGGGYWALTCPCDGTPGFILGGELHDELVTDWRFANDVDLC